MLVNAGRRHRSMVRNALIRSIALRQQQLVGRRWVRQRAGWIFWPRRAQDKRKGEGGEAGKREKQPGRTEETGLGKHGQGLGPTHGVGGTNGESHPSHWLPPRKVRSEQTDGRTYRVETALDGTRPGSYRSGLGRADLGADVQQPPPLSYSSSLLFLRQHISTPYGFWNHAPSGPQYSGPRLQRREDRLQQASQRLCHCFAGPLSATAAGCRTYSPRPSLPNESIHLLHLRTRGREFA